MTSGSRPRWFVLAAGICLVVIGLVAFVVTRGKQPAGEMSTVVTWGAPASGAPVVRYLLRIGDLAVATEDTFEVAAKAGDRQSYTVTRLSPGREYRACTAGIDERGRQGPWSGWSPVYQPPAATARN
jgi:hypothetical protein